MIAWQVTQYLFESKDKRNEKHDKYLDFSKEGKNVKDKSGARKKLKQTRPQYCQIRVKYFGKSGRSQINYCHLGSSE